MDVAVDLTGFTAGMRPAILGYRPAPVQINYLGYPGTLGAPWIDYLIADEFVVPRHAGANYSERIIRLPDCFQANDDRRAASGPPPTRSAAGLPETGPVLCSFNNPHKLNPDFFAVWMRLLQAHPESVLWLVAGTPTLQDNLRREALAGGIAPERVVFAPSLPYAEHLARLPLADLFLDSLPFNAGATASDALWSGVPVLTCSGEALASRMAGSLLNTLNLPELITNSHDDYEAVAHRLLCEPETLGAIRTRLAGARVTSPLFDTERFCRRLEHAYTLACQRAEQGLSPQDLDVPRA